MKIKIICVVSLIVFYCLIGVTAYQGGCRDTKILMLKKGEEIPHEKKYISGYKDGIAKTIEALSRLEGAQVYLGNLEISADHTVTTNCLFMYTEPLEYAIKIDNRSQNTLIHNISLDIGLAYSDK